MAIRIGTPRDTSLMMRRLAPMPLYCVVAPGYIQKHGAPSHPKDLTHHNILVDDNHKDADNWKFHRGSVKTSVAVHGSFRSNAPNALAEMAKSGVGIALCPPIRLSSTSMRDGC